MLHRSVIDIVLGLRSTSFGYQYSEIIHSLSSIYFCGGNCVEDVTSHLMSHLSLQLTLWTFSSNTILRGISELGTANTTNTFTNFAFRRKRFPWSTKEWFLLFSVTHQAKPTGFRRYIAIHLQDYYIGCSVWCSEYLAVNIKSNSLSLRHDARCGTSPLYIANSL